MLPSEDQDLIRERIRKLIQKASDLGIKDEEFRSLFSTGLKNADTIEFKWALKTKLLFRKFLQWSFERNVNFVTVLIVIIGIFVSSAGVREMFIKNVNETCILDLSYAVIQSFRPQLPCGICKNLKQVPVVQNISAEEFHKLYAYTGVPLLIKGGVADWEALQTFNYQYFKKIYTSSPKFVEEIMDDCQFFEYMDAFSSLEEVFDMPDERAAAENGTEPWYIGWSHCLGKEHNISANITSQYHRPHFLPKHSINQETTWIFMGSPGYGAKMHVDNVEFPSWQAQVSGSKTWFIQPPHECRSQCHDMAVTVEKGDIFVLDTNIWYHATRVNPGNISVSVGAEYD